MGTVPWRVDITMCQRSPRVFTESPYYLLHNGQVAWIKERCVDNERPAVLCAAARGAKQSGHTVTAETSAQAEHLLNLARQIGKWL